MDKDQQENEIAWNYSHTAGKGDIIVHPNGEYFFTAGSDGVIRVFPTNDSMEMECKEFTNNEGSVNCLTVSPDGAYLASGSEDNKVLLFNCSELKFEKILTQTQTPINCLTFSPDSSFLAVGSESSEIKIVPLDDPTSHYFLKGHAGPVKALSWDPQGTFLASASEDGSVRIFNVDDRQEVKVIPSIEGKEENGGKQLYRLSWSNDGDYLAIAGSFGEKIPFFKRSSMMNLFTLYTDHIKSISIVKFSPDGIHFASVGCDNKVYLWDLEEKKVVNCFEHGSTIYGIDWNSTKNEIILIDENGELGRWAKPVKEVIKQASSSSSSSSESSSGSNSESESESGSTSSSSGSSSNSDSENGSDKDKEEEEEEEVKEKQPLLIEDDLEFEIVEEKNEMKPENRIQKKSQLNENDISRKRKQFSNSSDSEIEMEEGLSELQDKKFEEFSIPKSYLNKQASKKNTTEKGSGKLDGNLFSSFKIPIQKPFIPSSTPSIENRRYMTWNLIGSITKVVEESISSIQVDFMDKTRHRPLRLNDIYNLSLGALSHYGVFFASQPENKTNKTNGNNNNNDNNKFEEIQTSTLLFKPLDSWSSHADWVYQLPKNENAIGLAVGNDFAAVATEKGYVRIFSFGALQKYIFSLPGPFVTMATDGEDHLLIIYYTDHFGTGGLNFKLINIKENKKVSEGKVPLSNSSELRWVSFIENKPSTFVTLDSRGIFRILSNSIFGQSWVPVLDLTNPKYKNEKYFPIGMTQKQLIAAITPEQFEYPSTLNPPVPRSIDLQIPLLHSSDRSYYQAENNTMKMKIFQDNKPTQQTKTVIDQLLIKQFEQCFRTDQIRALDLCKQMNFIKALQISFLLSTRAGTSSLGKQIQNIIVEKKWKMMQEQEEHKKLEKTNKLQEQEPEPQPQTNHKSKKHTERVEINFEDLDHAEQTLNQNTPTPKRKNLLKLRNTNEKENNTKNLFPKKSINSKLTKTSLNKSIKQQTKRKRNNPFAIN
ncbi:wd repeat and hmg-box DNA binding protein [Anaeramoeba flamelloides]|uniref:Wd repeat and hmg-box DNA binding protein n=1 Tax=Anaeramoeba flamelloides TaxID=1746091 RepID=A0ABQ8YD35_9EUKA|nr:wd repeat and hmg-box DNA binding protein [Anaeramoeba flamelloides]